MKGLRPISSCFGMHVAAYVAEDGWMDECNKIYMYIEFHYAFWQLESFGNFSFPPNESTERYQSKLFSDAF